MDKVQLELLARCLVVIKNAKERGCFTDPLLECEVDDIIGIEAKMVKAFLNRPEMDDAPAFDGSRKMYANMFRSMNPTGAEK